jgi:uncharacterized protein YjdB
MSVTLNVGQTVSFTVAPLTASGAPSSATLSNLSFTSSDPTIFTVVPDPANPNGGIVTSVAAGSGTITAAATATEPDGVTTEQITGTDTVNVSAVAPPPAASLGFTWGTPTP